MEKLRVLFVFGTRPEAIKLAPLIHQMRKEVEFDVRVCSTAQHREMTDQVVRFFGLPVDYDLDLMRPGQSLPSLTARLFSALAPVLADVTPDLLIVQGDTTTAFAAAMSGFYSRARIAHIEAGLRSHNKFAPFPEEVNRTLISHLADFHFAPTAQAERNLAREGIKENVWVVGNTVIDALFLALDLLERNGHNWIRKELLSLDFSKRILLATAHRRENLGEPLQEICLAVQDIVDAFPDVEVIFPVHPNPRVQKIVRKMLGGVRRVHLFPPLTYPEFVWVMRRAYLILTDSGGVQEEAPALGKPVLVMREVTERQEGIEAGVARLVGVERGRIFRETASLLTNPETYAAMAHAENPYGNGDSCAKIIGVLKQAFGGKT